ncbi:MAG: hypothetical protein FD166_413 [Bacteroidetes bacterium]|nr:MAG: hypothetical protein FD166_413 [Bacteroidota bacterium]
MKNLLILVFTGALIYGCSNSSNPPAATDAQNQINENQVVFENDMESALAGIPAWSNEKTIIRLSEGVKAHSGEFVTKVDEVDLYSYAFKETFENINEKLPKNVIVKGWFYSPVQNPELGFVMDINENNSTKIWQSYKLMEASTSVNEWHEFTATFAIDQPVKPSYQIKLFGFGAKKTAYFDDLKVTFEF